MSTAKMATFPLHSSDIIVGLRRVKMFENNYCTIIDAISDLQARGFVLDFNIIGNNLRCAQEKRYVCPEEFVVLEMYVFRPDGPGRNETAVYAIESFRSSLRGILLDSSIQKMRDIPSIPSRSA